MTFLEKVLKEKKKVVKDSKTKTPLSELRQMIGRVEKRPFYQTFNRRFPEDVKIIAEVKKTSPSKGVIICKLDLPVLLMDYERGGASAKPFFNSASGRVLRVSKSYITNSG